MKTSYIIEAIGYTGSLLVVVSMLMTSVKRLRIVNTTGSVIFAVYALIIHSYPTALMNMCLVAINIYQLHILGSKGKHYQLTKVSAGEGMMKYLCEYYYEDITKFFPSVALDAASDCDQAYIISCDAVPAGLLLGNETEKGVITIIVDYATPAYRDTSVGTFLYDKLSEYGMHKLVFSGKSVGHEEYLVKMGFEQEPNAVGGVSWVKQL